MPDIPESVQIALEHLLQVSSEASVVVAGFVFHREGKFIVNFGNCSDHGDVKLFEELCRIRDESLVSGNVTYQAVNKVN